MWAPLGDSSRAGLIYALGVARNADDERFELADLDQLATFAQLVVTAAVDRETGACEIHRTPAGKRSCRHNR